MRRANRSNRPLVAVALIALVLVSVVTTWIASGRIRSPAEVAARTLAPEPSPILVPVERRVISSDVVTRGTGRFGSPQTLHLVPSALKVAPRFVDTVPSIGSELSDGQVVLVVSGRPVILLEGAQPTYRDLGPGAFGTDVEQLEVALERFGFDAGVTDGRYDDATERAVAAWYRSLGFEPVTATDAQLAEIRALEADLAAAEREALGAEDAVAAAAADLLAAQYAHRVAVAAEVDAKRAVAEAQSQADAATAVAEAEALAAEAAAEQAWIALPPEWSSDDESRAALFELESLRLAARSARAHAELVEAEGTALVGDAAFVAAQAPGEVAAAAAAVQVAQQRLDLARQASSPAGTPPLAVENTLAEARSRAGVQVPADEVIFVPAVPVRVADVLIERGLPAEGPLVAVTDAVLAIDGTLALDQVALIEAGMTVLISEPDLGIEATGRVGFVAEGPGTRGADGFHVYFETVVTESRTPVTNIASASVRLTIPVQSSEGAVLAVPASALTLASDGSSQLLVERDGALVTVVVEPGLSASGYVAIDQSAGIDVGDMVVVGFERAGPSGG